jgi:Fe-S-cluster containining protein
MRIPSLDKPPHQPCAHQGDAGCAIYDRRPDECRHWHCLWVRDEGRIFSDHHRPDRLGVFFTASSPDPITGVQTLFAHETEPGIAETPEPLEAIAFLRQFAPVQVVRKPAWLVPLTISA